MQQYFAFYPETFMQIRDLTKMQCYRLRQRCEKDRKKWEKERRQTLLADELGTWHKAYSAGVRAGLEQHPSGRESITPPPA